MPTEKGFDDHGPNREMQRTTAFLASLGRPSPLISMALGRRREVPVEIKIAESESELRRCYPVMVQLRQHLGEDEFISRVRRQVERYGYGLVYVEDDGKVRAVAGYRISECLCDGRFLYVDDLVTDVSNRSRGYGEQLLAWLVAKGREEGCSELGLESGVQRHDAHRFYLRSRMRISSYHFSLSLRDVPGAAQPGLAVGPGPRWRSEPGR